MTEELSLFDRSELASKSVATFRGKYIEVTNRIESMLDLKLTAMYSTKANTEKGDAFRHILLTHRDISFFTKIELLRYGCRFIKGHVSANEIAKRLQEQAERRNQLAHINWNGLSFKNESPEDVLFELVSFKNGVEKRIRITTWDSPSWLDEAEFLFKDMMNFGLEDE